MLRKAINIFSLDPCNGNCALSDAVYVVNFTAFFALSVHDMRHISYFNSHVCKNNFCSFIPVGLWDLLPNYYEFSLLCMLAHVATICDAFQHNCFRSWKTKYTISIKVTMNSTGTVQQRKRPAAKTKAWKLYIETRCRQTALQGDSISTGLTHLRSTREWNKELVHRNSYFGTGFDQRPLTTK
jgi:hypothetical protein